MTHNYSVSKWGDICVYKYGFPGGSDGERSACNVGDPGSVPGFGKSPAEGNSYPPQYSCLDNSTDKGAWQAI